MGFIINLFKGIVILFILALADHGFTVKDIISKTADSHKKGLRKYGEYSRILGPVEVLRPSIKVSTIYRHMPV